MAFCLVFGWFYLIPSDYKLLEKQIAAGAAFISNIIYMRESGYFDVASSKKVLLHLWSLGVEEQYYIAWPIVLYVASKRRFLGAATLVIIAASFAYNVHEINVYAPTAFYSPFSRIWEFMIGGVLAQLQSKKMFAYGVTGQASPPSVFSLADGGSILGFVLVCHAAATISADGHFPGWIALEPVAGATLILAAGPQAWINRVLSKRLFVWVGLISYPLYLWHWPLLALARDIHGELSPQVRLGLVLASVPAAWLTYVLVEKPIRFSQVAWGRPAILVTAMACLGGAGLSLHNWAPSGLRPIAREAAPYTSFYGRLNDHNVLAPEVRRIFNFQCGFYNQKAEWRGHPTNVPWKPACNFDPLPGVIGVEF